MPLTSVPLAMAHKIEYLMDQGVVCVLLDLQLLLE